MSEVGGITELQMLEAEATLLLTKQEKVQSAETTSAVSSRLAESILSAQAKDGFLQTEGRAPNVFHTSAGSAGDQGCCVVS